MSLYTRLVEGRKPKITKAMLAKGKKPADISWKDWLAAGGQFGKGRPKPKKYKKAPKGAFHDPYKHARALAKTRKKPKQSKLFGKNTPWDDWDDDWAKPMGSTALGSKKVPKPVYTLEQMKIKQLARTLGTIDRTAAGGVVFKSFKGPDVWELLVVASKTAPRWGGAWVFPKGGLDLGETLYKGATREVREESGVKAKVVSSRSHITVSKFGDRGKYDLALVIDLLKKKNPKDAEFIEKHREEFKFEYFTYKNHSHYFVMRQTGGKPRKTMGKDEEMAMSEWVPLRVAIGRGYRMKDVVKNLLPTILKLWSPPKGVRKPARLKMPFHAPKPIKTTDKSAKTKSSTSFKDYLKGGSPFTYSAFW